MQLDLVPIQSSQPQLDLQPLVRPDINSSSKAGQLAGAIAQIPGVQQIANITQPTTDKVAAFSHGAVQGALNAVGDMGTLAANILKGAASEISPNVAAGVQSLQNQAGASFGALKDVINNNTVAAQSGQDNPRTHLAGNLVGYIGANAGLAGAATSGIKSLASPLIKATSPYVGDITGQIGTQSTFGAISGAASNPNDPAHGAITGGLAGMAIGGITGYIGSRVREAGKIIERESEIAQNAGQALNSPGVINRTRSQLLERGLDMKKDAVRDIAQQNVTDIINKIAPEGSITENPTQTIINQASKNWKVVKPQSDANYQPLMEAPGVAPASNLNQSIQTVGKNLPTLGLPKKALPEDGATLGQMITYQRNLQGIQNSAFKQVRNGLISHEDASLYTQVSQALDKDIAQLADSQGLSNQLQTANQFWKANILPFNAFNKGGLARDPADIEKAFKSIATQLRARGVPDITTLNNASKAIGPDGQRVTGYALIQTLYRRSFNNEGEFDPGKFENFARRLQEMGADSKIMTPEHIAVLNGLRKSAAATTKILKQSAPALPPGMIGFVQQKIQEIAHTETGISLLRIIGSSSTKAQVSRNLIQKLVTGTYIHLGSEANQQEQASN